MKTLYIGDKKRENYLNQFEYRYLLETYPLSTFEIKEALSVYLTNDCERIVGIGDQSIRDFIKILGLVAENNYSWKDLFFNPQAITSYPEVIFWAEDIISFGKESKAFLCDFNSLEMIGIEREIFRGVIVESCQDIFNLTTDEERRLAWMITVEEGRLQEDISLVNRYIEGDFHAYLALIELLRDGGEKNPILKCLPYLMPYSNNSYGELVSFYKELIISYSKKEMEVKGLYEGIGVTNIQMEEDLLDADKKKLSYLMSEKEMLNNRIIDEVFKKLEK